LPASSPPAAPAPDQPTEGKKPLSNLAQRLIFGVLGAVALLGCVWYSAWTFALFFAAVQAKMLLEFYRMMRAGGYQPAKWLGLAASVVIFAAVNIYSGISHYLHLPSFKGGYTVYPSLRADDEAYAGMGASNEMFDATFLMGTLPKIYAGFGAVLLLLMLALVMWEMAKWPKEKHPFINVSTAYGGLFYVSLPMSLLSLIAFGGNGQYDYRRIFALLFLVWCSDIGAYAAGKTFGKHKLAPKISPGKTWEGAVGGFLLTLAMGWALGYWLTDLSLTYRLVAAGTVAVFGPLGDLAESMLKRSVDVKDSGTIMPGHGGLLDRFDAFLFILPVLALLQLLLG